MKFSQITQTAVDAALLAGEIIRKGFGTSYEISLKPGIQNFVTPYDHAAEEAILSTIKMHFPDHGFLCEESGASANQDAEIVWLIDPLDGTANFYHRVPIFAVSIGAVSPEKGVVSGVIYQPMTHELFVAEKGLGAYFNHKPMRVSSTKEISGGIVATGFPRNVAQNPQNCIDHFIHILKRDTVIRNLGSSAINIAYVAAGRYDAYWAVSLHPWDIAAAVLLVEEAGGKISSFNGNPYDILSSTPLAASNGVLHEELISILRGNN